MDACEVRLSNRLSCLIEFRPYSGNFREKNFFVGVPGLIVAGYLCWRTWRYVTRSNRSIIRHFVTL